MGRGALSWRRLGQIALAVLAVHALLLQNLHDALTARAGSAPQRNAAALQVRTVLHAPAASADQAPVAVAPAALALRPAPLVASVAPALAKRPAPAREIASVRSAPQNLAATAETVPSVTAVGEPIAPSGAAPAPPGATIASAPAANAWGDLPIYRTLVPPAFTFGYELRRGAASGSGELSWQPQGEHYRARLAGSAGSTPMLALDSVGSFDDAGIAPARYTDRRRNRGTQAANFRREMGKITYSGPAVEHALPPGAQDRLSWMLQLAAIAAAEPALVGPGGRVSFLVVGARGDADVWTFFHAGVEALALPEGSTPTVRLLREPGRAFDTRAEVWLDPARHYLPVRARLANASDSDALLLVLREVLTPPRP